MVKLDVAEDLKFSVRLFELEKSGKSYTVDTLKKFREKMVPDGSLFLIIGADNAVDMTSWHLPETVLSLAQVLVAERPGFDRGKVDPGLRTKMTFVRTPLLEISSTAIRDRVKKGQSIRYWVPDAVREYVSTHTLYR